MVPHVPSVIMMIDFIKISYSVNARAVLVICIVINIIIETTSQLILVYVTHFYDEGKVDQELF